MVLLVWCACKSTAPVSTRLLHESKSQFNHIFVREEPDGSRTLQFGDTGVTQSAVNVSDPLDLRLKYTRATTLAWALVPEPKRIMILGLGGGALPRFFYRVLPDAHIDVAELDPAVADVAREYFDLPKDPRLEVHIGDGRKYVQDATVKWDLIVLDAYGDSDIPRHLATLEFLNEVKQHLAPKGVVAGNVWSRDSNVLYDAMVRTWTDAYGALCVVEVDGSSNRIFLAGNGVDVAAPAIRDAVAKLKSAFPVKEYAPAECLHDAHDQPALRDQ